MTDQPNEILATAAEAKSHAEAARAARETSKARRWDVGQIGLGVGIGSAAVAAAVLFSRRGKGK